MSENIIERYLSDIGGIHNTGAHVAETSFYPALERLLTDIGSTLTPKVRCVINLKNSGGGIPDGGLFTADQFRHHGSEQFVAGDFLKSQPPARGVIEAKAPHEDVNAVAATEQVRRYWEHYRVVLVTNFRAFVLIGSNPAGQPCMLEAFSLADSADEFWRLVGHPRKAAAEQSERLLEYLKRVLLCNAPLARPEDVAAILASYAHDARLRIQNTELPALQSLRDALEQALGLHFEGERGEHFFRSTLIQTLFYGVFSAWVLWARNRPAKIATLPGFQQALHDSSASYGAQAYFDWRTAQYLLRVPMLQGLFAQVAAPGPVGSLGLIEVLDWTAAALNRVDHHEFFKSFDEGHAVQYFYEPFLHAFDPVLRKELGVWYTPEEIVRYQVERVDAVLRSELGIADGLADPKVVVLDPCCGTGAYLRAVLRRIATTLQDKGGDALMANDLKRAAMNRVFGFEILPAPFVIAHLQLGLELETLGAPLGDHVGQPERVGVYLTNALTGWEPPKEKAKQIAFPGFDNERDAANKVKQEKPILVIIGNPPYNAYAGVSPEEENDLVQPYKDGLYTEWGIKKFNLDDLYIRFFRLAEKRVAEHGGRGVVSFISNFSYLGDPSFVVARRRFLDEFDAMWFDCLNGDSRETGKLTPDGNPDPSVFSTEWNREGIRVGTAIGLLVKRNREREQTTDTTIRFRHFWGTNKRGELLASLDADDFDGQYDVANPSKDNRWSFRPSDVADAYLVWPKLTDLCAEPPSNGPIERRANSLIVFPDEKDRLALVKDYLDSSVSNDDITRIASPFMTSSGEFNAEKARALLKGRPYNADNIVKYPFKPFDVRLAYLSSDIAPLFSRPSPTLLQQRFPGNKFFITRDTADKNPEGPPFFFAPLVCDYDCISGHARHFPLRLRSVPKTSGGGKFLPGMADEASNKITANLSPSARAYLSSLGYGDADGDPAVAELIWYHALAIGYSPAYLREHADGVRQDWPRIPLPHTREILAASAALGRQIAALLDTEAPAPGVTAGKIPEKLKTIAVFTRPDGKPVNLAAGDLDLSAGWGHAGKGGVTMPGKGKLHNNDDGTCDVFLNDVTCWQNIPTAVWEYCIGGYQVIKKWLSYREKTLLGRGLTIDEVRYVTDMARRIAALVDLHVSLDDNYRQTCTHVSPWQKN
ncbi:type ISP restriction/modification enzyme [Oligosphaera ethanolica]|uniref:site-specific DNA-methyltransferase (adenine-specific) n=1 Tax=Oligosphaera ethanolica TaxID=760260 RepID=A0AAE4AL85_9BACT|nr:type ISP restriction/modification enzyme [Oligosphaera ethanolica]MDQ0287994.1 hypothetical protein [Oligosphaera ethanolica]